MNDSNGAPEPIPRETTDPQPVLAVVDRPPPEEPVRDAAERAGWLQVLTLAAIGIFVAGGTSYAVVARLATKADLDAAMARHAAAPPDPALVKRIDEIDRWREVHAAEHRADLEWLKAALTRIEERLDRKAR